MKIKLLNLKNTIKITLSLILLFFLTAFPNICIKGAQNGFKTALFCVLPSVLPFMIISKYLLSVSNPNNKIIDFLAKIFNISKNGMYCVIFGSLSGYPTGAILLADQVKKKEYLQKRQNLFFHTQITAVHCLLLAP